jgi:hypothetical protein
VIICARRVVILESSARSVLAVEGPDKPLILVSTAMVVDATLVTIVAAGWEPVHPVGAREFRPSSVPVRVSTNPTAVAASV